MTQCGAPTSNGSQDPRLIAGVEERAVSPPSVGTRPPEHARAIGTPDRRDLLDSRSPRTSSAREWIRLCWIDNKRPHYSDTATDIVRWTA